ncbi:Hypothetical protein, putative [Bodo saltans]|uniref:Uncharacterized protein n=1 Tax=Bodo saltans TaxID=75058 RepID=A0A0S4KII5_BODSA|nr:Hypothetical protein, putative [Bodo saltans]|eukprot:CUI14956.1 Hypothetical protein, putative [Bodo saltans]
MNHAASASVNNADHASVANSSTNAESFNLDTILLKATARHIATEKAAEERTAAAVAAAIREREAAVDAVFYTEGNIRGYVHGVESQERRVMMKQCTKALAHLQYAARQRLDDDESLQRNVLSNEEATEYSSHASAIRGELSLLKAAHELHTAMMDLERNENNVRVTVTVAELREWCVLRDLSDELLEDIDEDCAQQQGEPNAPGAAPVSPGIPASSIVINEEFHRATLEEALRALFISEANVRYTVAMERQRDVTALADIMESMLEDISSHPAPTAVKQDAALNEGHDETAACDNDATTEATTAADGNGPSEAAAPTDHYTRDDHDDEGRADVAEVPAREATDEVRGDTSAPSDETAPENNGASEAAANTDGIDTLESPPIVPQTEDPARATGEPSSVEENRGVGAAPQGDDHVMDEAAPNDDYVDGAVGVDHADERTQTRDEAANDVELLGDENVEQSGQEQPQPESGEEEPSRAGGVAARVDEEDVEVERRLHFVPPTPPAAPPLQQPTSTMEESPQPVRRAATQPSPLVSSGQAYPRYIRPAKLYKQSPPQPPPDDTEVVAALLQQVSVGPPPIPSMELPSWFLDDEEAARANVHEEWVLETRILAEGLNCYVALEYDWVLAGWRRVVRNDEDMFKRQGHLPTDFRSPQKELFHDRLGVLERSASAGQSPCPPSPIRPVPPSARPNNRPPVIIPTPPPPARVVFPQRAVNDSLLQSLLFHESTGRRLSEQDYDREFHALQHGYEEGLHRTLDWSRGWCATENMRVPPKPSSTQERHLPKIYRLGTDPKAAPLSSGRPPADKFLTPGRRVVASDVAQTVLKLPVPKELLLRPTTADAAHRAIHQ